MKEQSSLSEMEGNGGAAETNGVDIQTRYTVRVKVNRGNSSIKVTTHPALPGIKKNNRSVAVTGGSSFKTPGPVDRDRGPGPHPVCF